MSDDSDPAALLLQFFQAALEKRSPERERAAAKRIGAAVAETADGWPSAIRRTLEWLKTDPLLWTRAARIAAAYLDTEVTAPLASEVLLRELLQVSPSGANAFFSSIKDEQALHEFTALLPDLVLQTEAVLALLERCASFRPEGECPAAADKLTAWASKNSTLARAIVDQRVAARDRDHALPIWAIEPLVEGVTRSEAVPVNEGVAWRDATVTALLNSPNPRRQSLAAYLSCTAWPDVNHPVEERHGALLAIVRRSPEELLPSALDALMRDVWAQHEAVFETLVAISELIDEAVPRQERAIRLHRKVLDIILRGLASAEGKVIPPTVEKLLPHLQTIPPSEPRDHVLDHLLSILFTRARGVAEPFLLGYLRTHAGIFLRSGRTFDEAFPLLKHAAGAGVVGSWILRWMVDSCEPLRVCAAQWAGNSENIQINRETLAELTSKQAAAIVHVIMMSPVGGKALFALLSMVAETREDLRELLRVTFLDELFVDYPGLTRRWVEDVEGRGDRSPSPICALAADLRAKQTMHDGLLNSRREIPELYATSPCFLPWMELHNQIQATQQKDARKLSIFSQLMNHVHVARGESMTHTLGSEPTSLVHHEFSGEQPVRTVLDPVGLQLVQIQHAAAARELLAPADST